MHLGEGNDIGHDSTIKDELESIWWLEGYDLGNYVRQIWIHFFKCLPVVEVGASTLRIGEAEKLNVFNRFR